MELRQRKSQNTFGEEQETKEKKKKNDDDM